jgi:hypothetical protein
MSDQIKVLLQWDDLEIKRDKGRIESATLRYNIIGTKNAATADAYLIAMSPETILGGLKRGTSAVTKIASNGFEGVIEYVRKENTFTFSFETTGGTQHITQSYQTLGRYAAESFTAPNHKGAIGVTDRDVTGCDVIAPQLGFTMSKTFDGTISIDFIKTLAGMTGRINSNPFLTFEPGEVLFEGASGSQRGNESFDVSYKFKASPNVNGLEVGEIQVEYKRGWDYFWVQYLEKEDTESKTTKKVPFAAFVEAVYQEADFSPLM